MNDLLLIGKIIKVRRLSLNMRMDDLAKKAGITRSTLWGIEKGVSNCSASTLFKVMNLLELKFSVSFTQADNSRLRATRINTVLDKKINRFIIMCVEQYAKSTNQSSDIAYKEMSKNGVLEELTNDYEDLHGMSTMYLNSYIGDLIARGANA